MGQYHHPVCIEAEEGLSPHTFGVGLKEGEQGFSTPSTPHAMVALVKRRTCIRRSPWSAFQKRSTAA